MRVQKFTLSGHFEVKYTHKCGVFAPHHTVCIYNKRGVVRALLKAEVQVLVFIYILMKYQYLVQVGTELGFGI